MKSKVSYSLFATLLTTILSVGLLAGCIATYSEKITFVTLLVNFLALIVSALFWGPVYIEADSDSIILGSVLRRKKLPMADVERVEQFQPTMGEIRVFASGGFMGYWGIFSDGGVGRYYGFYGKASDCFLVQMKNGDRYVLGCNQPVKMIGYIKSKL